MVNKEILNALKKKWYIIFVCACICSCLLYVEKSTIAPSITKTGTYVYTMNIRFDSNQQLNDDSIVFDVKPVSREWSNLDYFLNKLEKNDMSIVCSQWNDLRKTEKFAWINKHFRSTNIAVNNYELIFTIAIEELDESFYTIEFGDKLLMEYGEYISEIVPRVTHKKDMEVINKYYFDDTNETVTEKSVKQKYAVIGFILGTLAASSCISLLAFKKKAS